LENRQVLSLVLKVVNEEDLRIGSCSEFHSAGPATLNILLPKLYFDLWITVSPFET